MSAWPCGTGYRAHATRFSTRPPGGRGTGVGPLGSSRGPEFPLPRRARVLPAPRAPLARAARRVPRAARRRPRGRRARAAALGRHRGRPRARVVPLPDVGAPDAAGATHARRRPPARGRRRRRPDRARLTDLSLTMILTLRIIVM